MKLKIPIITLMLAIIIITINLSGCLLVGDQELAEFICENSKDKDHCYKWYAVKESSDKAGLSDTLCAKIENPGPKSKCYAEVADFSGDVAFCNKMEAGFGAYNKEDCIQRFAINHKKPDLCYMIDLDYRSDKTDITPKGVSEITRYECVIASGGKY